MRQIITHFTDDDLYKFTMCCAVIDNYPRAQVKYKFIDRDSTIYPTEFAKELREQISALGNLKISEDEIAYMKLRCRTYRSGFTPSLKDIAITRKESP